MWRIEETREEGAVTNVWGDKNAMLALLYSLCVLMKNPLDPMKIIYFPIKNNAECTSCSHKTLKEDIVFTTTESHFKVTDWNMYLKLFERSKQETYVFRYDKDQIESLLKEREHNAQDRRKRINGYKLTCFDTLFLCVNQMAYMEAYKNVRKLIDENMDGSSDGIYSISLG